MEDEAASENTRPMGSSGCAWHAGKGESLFVVWFIPFFPIPFFYKSKKKEIGKKEGKKELMKKGNQKRKEWTKKNYQGMMQ